MSNHPIPPATPYWGPPNYTQQWTPQQPPSGPMPHNPHFNADPSSVPQQYHNFEGFYANANLPGLGGAGATGAFPPPPFAFPGAFSPAAAPHFATMPNVGYPSMPGPLPSAPSHLLHHQPSTNGLVDPTHSNALDSQPMTTTSSRQDLDREEGELTDIEGPATTEQQRHSQSNARHLQENTFGNQKPDIAGNAKVNGAQMEHTHSTASNGLHPNIDRRESLSELEEGEASPERASSRDSGSPYNPPMPTNSRSPSMPKSFPQNLQPFGEELHVNPSLPISIDSQESSGPSISLAQLRVQAQGALLSLAPHSIRYSELVGEGINPMVLKQLYEDVGIKVPTTPPTNRDHGTVSSENFHPGTNPSVAKGKAEQTTQQLEHQVDAPRKPSFTEPSLTPPQSTQANTAKPMERKEVIARMLAAKAAKSSPASAQAQPDAAQTAPPSQSLPAAVEKPTATTPSRDLSVNDKESRVKEKNRAQTELARQRIELLRKQGLVRNLQKPQSDNQLSEKGQISSIQESPHAVVSTVVQHPLPERPPLPESLSLDHIPGLFMTEQASEATNGAHITPVRDSILESVPYPRSTQRKRPRASDFDDDPIPEPKRTLGNGTNHVPPERLVIDISDDEFYGDDEDGNMHAKTTLGRSSKGPGDLTADGSPRVYPSPIDGLPHRPATSQSQEFSMSATPNNSKISEQEHLRKKNLEIQAMHRRIAELEQRKKAKLASRTQSPRASDLSPPELVSMPTVSVPATPVVTDKNVENILAPMDTDSLRKMKSKILRMQEIEAGVPSLEAEIQKSETKLADTKREEEKLSSELAKGKEGRRQLLEELNTLKLEISGLSLDHVNAALLSMEAKEELPVEVVQAYNHYAIAPGYGNETASGEGAKTPSKVPETDVQVREDATLPQHAIPTVSKSPSAENSSDAPNVGEDNPILNAPREESADTSMSEVSSSSMDESTDDSSSDSGSLNEDMPDVQDFNTNRIPAIDEIATTTPGPMNGPERPQGTEAILGGSRDSGVEDKPLSDHQSLNTPAQTENLAIAGEVSRVSPVSEAYEPPEPGESTSASNLSYSPAPSPDFPSPTTNMEVSGSSEDQSQEAGEPLIEKVQELDFQQPSQHSQIDVLDNTRHPEDSQRKFSPYTSPLKLFKAYRYHPKYNDNVSGGYRSLTFSHNIDALKYLCPFETSGGVCNDRSCEYQHFRDMALSGASTFEQSFARLYPSF
ncbi:hypothetical protein BDW62DRAFT_191576 [Aspergillus aurantiobrunneus]